MSVHVWPVTAVLMLAAASALFTACGKETAGPQGGGPPPPSVSVAEVVVRDVTPWDAFTGRIEAMETVQIRPRVAGVVDEVRYREGDIVRKGELLFLIDQRPFRAELARAEAELARAEAQAELARAESARAQNIFERKLLSQDDYDQRVAAAHQAEANRRAAEAALQLARLDLGYTEIRAPIDGRAGRALATRGNLVSSDPTPDVLTTVVSLDPVHVYFEADELTYLRHAGGIRRGGAQPDTLVNVGLAGEDGFPRQGRVDFVDNQMNPQTGTIRMRAVLDNKDRQLTPGLFARVQLLAPAPVTALLIVDDAILTDQDRKFVYVLGPDNQALRRDITPGQSADGLRIVSAGLAAGDRVIVHGIQKVFFPGMPVVPQTITMGDPAPAPGPMAGAGH